MMAKDPTPPRRELSAASSDGLKHALRDFLGGGREEPTAAVQTALSRVACEARENRIHAEQLLVMLKDVWFSLPEVGSSRDHEIQDRLLQRVVTLCIREYYSAADGDGKR